MQFIFTSVSYHISSSCDEVVLGVAMVGVAMVGVVTVGMAMVGILVVGVAVASVGVSINHVIEVGLPQSLSFSVDFPGLSEVVVVRAAVS